MRRSTKKARNPKFSQKTAKRFSVRDETKNDKHHGGVMPLQTPLFCAFVEKKRFCAIMCVYT